MANKLGPTNDPSQPMIYQIRITGHLGRQWTDWFGGLVISLEDDGEIAEMSLGVGCVFLCALLFRTRLISRFLSLAGLIGDHSNVRNPYQAEAFAREERGVSSPWSRTTTRSPPRLGYRRRWSGKRNGGTVPPSA